MMMMMMNNDNETYDNQQYSFGQCIEEYKIISFLKKGGFAEVYRAKCRRQNIDVAVKRIDRKQMNEAGMMARVRLEIEIHRSLRHRSIVRLYTHFEDAAYIYIVLEYCPHGDLHQYLATAGERIMSERDCAHVMRQLLEALAYLHGRRIVHRDLSLSNLLLGSDGRVKISDFGMAARVHPSVRHVTMCGTPNYISPEVVSRSAHGFETDVWGLGCVLYVLLTGRAPFESDGVRRVLTRVVLDDYDRKPLDNLSEEAVDLIDALLQKDQTQRLPLPNIERHPFFAKYAARQQPHSLTFDSGIKTMSPMTTAASSNQLFAAKDPYCYQQQEPHRLQPLQSILGNSLISNGSIHSLSNNRARVTGPALNLGQQRAAAAAVSSAASEPNRVLPEYSLFRLFENAETKKSLSSILSERKQQKDRQNARNITVTKLSTLRLKPIRRRIKDTICTILANGEVCLEFLKKRNGGGTTGTPVEIVDNVCRVSADGMRIVIYRPDADKRRPATTPVPLPKTGTDLIFSYENLPTEFLNKYVYATRFVQLVQAITAKVTVYGDRAKHVLMESLVDFESTFYDGSRVVWSSNGDHVRVYDRTSGDTIVLRNVMSTGTAHDGEADDPLQMLRTQYLRSLWDQSSSAREKCFLIEDFLEQLAASAPPIVGSFGHFPVVIGQKPPTKIHVQPLPAPVPVAQAVIATATSTTRVPSDCNEPEIEIPGIGYASRITNRNKNMIRVRYLDKSILVLTDRNSIEYQNKNGVKRTYSIGSSQSSDAATSSNHHAPTPSPSKDPIPKELAQKLKNFDVIVRHLKKAKSTPPHHQSKTNKNR